MNLDQYVNEIDLCNPLFTVEKIAAWLTLI